MEEKIPEGEKGYRGVTTIELGVLTLPNGEAPTVYREETPL